jgi:predicted nucleic acid-binding Zn ribbon protein
MEERKKIQNELEFAETCRDVRARQRRPPDPPRAATLVNRLIARRGIAAEHATAELVAHWRQVVGEPLAGRTLPAAIRRGVLEVVVENSAVLQQLQFRQPDLLAAIQARLPQFAIQRLRLRVGPIR